MVEGWRVLTGLTRRPPPCKGSALPVELRTRLLGGGASLNALTHREANLHAICLVPRAGLEPAQLSPLPPQDSVSTNFTTWAKCSPVRYPVPWLKPGTCPCSVCSGLRGNPVLRYAFFRPVPTSKLSLLRREPQRPHCCASSSCNHFACRQFSLRRARHLLPALSLFGARGRTRTGTPCGGGF